MQGYNFSSGLSQKTSVYDLPTVRFYKKDKTTGKISPMSRAKVAWNNNRRDLPIHAMIK